MRRAPTYSRNRTKGNLSKTLNATRDVDLEKFLIESGLNERLNARLPVNIASIARSLGARSVTEADIPAAGMLVPVDSGFMILVNKNNPPARKRFSCAHEVAHALIDPESTSAQRQFPFGKDSELEKACERLASLLLMPNPVFRNHATAGLPSIAKVAKLAETFATSIQATALRFVKEIGERCLLIISEPHGHSDEVQLAVKWSSNNFPKSGARGVFVPRRARVGLRSAQIAYRTRDVQRDTETLSAGKYRLETYSESKAFGEGKSRYVLTLAFPDRT